MGTYDHKQVLLDYANGKITAEMAIGHALQHISSLYEAQTAANISRYELRIRSKVDTLDHVVKALQAKVERLVTVVEKFSAGSDRKSQRKQPKNPI